MFHRPLHLSMDEGLFSTCIFVVISLLLIFSKYQQGQIPTHNLHLFVINEAKFWPSICFKKQIFNSTNKYWIPQASIKFLDGIISNQYDDIFLISQ